MSQISPQSTFHFLSQGKTVAVHPDRRECAAEIDVNRDLELSNGEIMDYLKRTDALENPGDTSCDSQRVVQEFQAHLLKEIPPEAKGYHTYDQVTAEMQRLADTYSDHAQMVSLGKTSEGRDIWALKISSGAQSDDTRSKPGIVLSGCHHAREWMSMETPLRVATTLCEQYGSDPDITRRVDQAEIWVIPLVNPDGYEYSRTEDNWWRKNRAPVGETAVGVPTRAIGTDINRNYDDGKPEHAELYRPKGDKPGSTNDDFGGATSDRPSSDTYRGNKGGSESETQTMMNLELNRGNIKGVIDHHGYGEMILYPWGTTTDPVDNVDVYREIGAKMNTVMGDTFRLMQSTELYPTSGTSNDIQHANGILAFTIELGQSFQPDPSLIEPITKQVEGANMVFIDEVLARNSPPPPPPQTPPQTKGCLLAA